MTNASNWLRAVSFKAAKAILPRGGFVSAPEYRSDSDNGLYVASVKRAVTSDQHFKKFKRDAAYNEVLEHVSKPLGQDYLDILIERKDGVLELAAESVFKSDDIGAPRKFHYDTFGMLSSTTIRYAKVASDLKQLFGDASLKKIAEIGGGYGGLALVCDTLLNVKQYHVFDLPDVNRLIEKYLEYFLLNGTYATHTLNSAVPNDYDLVISNYAFSELPKAVQLKYIEKVLKRSKRAYLTMNSGNLDHADRAEEKLSLKELEELLPPFEIFEEKPLTSAGNYIIAWGHQPQSKL